MILSTVDYVNEPFGRRVRQHYRVAMVMSSVVDSEIT
jgi:hypothetical protein